MDTAKMDVIMKHSMEDLFTFTQLLLQGIIKIDWGNVTGIIYSVIQILLNIVGPLAEKVEGYNK